MADVRQLCPFADADQAHVETTRTDRGCESGLIAHVCGVRDGVFETGGVDVGQVVGHCFELALIGQHPGDRDPL